MNDGSCVRLKPRNRDHVWSYDFVHHRTDDGRVLRTLNILDEFSGECLEIRVKRKLNATDVVNTPTDLFILRGIPTCIRSDNGPEFVAKTVRDWIHAVAAKTAYIEPGFTWGERILRKLQCPLQRPTPEWRDLLHPARGTDHHRTMEDPLQHHQTTQRIGLPPSGSRIYHLDGSKADHALTFKLDQSVGAGHNVLRYVSHSPNIKRGVFTCTLI